MREGQPSVVIAIATVVTAVAGMAVVAFVALGLAVIDKAMGLAMSTMPEVLKRRPDGAMNIPSAANRQDKTTEGK